MYISFGKEREKDPYLEDTGKGIDGYLQSFQTFFSFCETKKEHADPSSYHLLPGKSFCLYFVPIFKGQDSVYLLNSY